LGRVLFRSTVSGWLGWSGFSCSIGQKPFSVGLVDQLFQPASNQVETVEKLLAATAKDVYSQELPRFNRKRLEKWSIEKRQPYQPKPVAVETVDLNRTRPYFLWLYRLRINIILN
jgi:hypothetical protein